MNRLLRLFSLPLLGVVYLWRYGVAPVIPAACRFSPSCSEYALIAIKTWGPWYGSLLTVRRLLRCHPFSRCHGYDPVPADRRHLPVLRKEIR